MAIFYADSGSFKSLTITGSMKIVNGGVMQGTASYALTASYAMNGGGGGTTTGSFTGSSTGFAMDPGDVVFLNIVNTNKIWVQSNSGTQVITYLAS
mgnify:CR=1 FL=1